MREREREYERERERDYKRERERAREKERKREREKEREKREKREKRRAKINCCRHRLSLCRVLHLTAVLNPSLTSECVELRERGGGGEHER
jgi:hypothetical protein